MTKKSRFEYRKGEPLPIGTSLIGNDVNLSVSVPNVDRCKLNIYLAGELNKYEEIILDEDYKTGNVFSVRLVNFEYDKYEYSYEVMNKEFVDSYATVIRGRSRWGKPVTKKKEKLVRGGFYFDDFDWSGDVKLKTSYSDTIMYKTHVRGFTSGNNSKTVNKGTFAGITEKIPYLKELGITCLVLLPVYDFNEILVDKYIVGPEEPTYMEYRTLAAKQNEITKDPVAEHFVRMKVIEGVIPYKVNYWGYSEECSYFAPKASYATDTVNPCDEFKRMVKQLHMAGIELILEFNFEYWVNKRLVLDCLRHWVLQYHVDGFRVNDNVVPLDTIATDPILADTKLLSDGWDINAIYKEEYVPCNKNLAECNDGFMADARKFTKGDECQVSNFSFRFRRNNSKCAIINYIANSNGFTLADTFSYDVKHNEDNGEANRDGTEYNFSWNCGFEGVTKRKKVLQLRKRMIKNALVTLLLSQGTPMILGGDEMCNSQNGNNNAYCQDNQTAWLNWNMNMFSKEIFEFTKMLIEIRKKHPILRMNEEFKIRDYLSCGYPDLSYHGTKAWFPDFSNYSRTIGILLCGDYVMTDIDAAKSIVGKKERLKDDFFYFAYNMHWESHQYDLPKLPADHEWKVLIDTHSEKDGIEQTLENNSYMVKERSVVVFISVKSAKKKKITPAETPKQKADADKNIEIKVIAHTRKKNKTP